MRLWTLFFNKLRNHPYTLDGEGHGHFARSCINARLSTYDGYINPSDVKLFNLDKWIDKMVLTYVNNLDMLKTMKGAADLEKKVGDVIHEMWKDYLQLRDKPSTIQKICSNILDQIEYQEDPINRKITDVSFESLSRSIDSLDTIPVYKVFITSNCDGWAEDTDKFIGYSLKNEPKMFIDKTEAEVIEWMNSIETFIEFLNHLDDFIETVEKQSDEELNSIWDDFGKVFFKHDNPYADIIEEFACQHLITNSGKCNRKNISRLRDAGFNVYAGDSDSFGWLTGCIENTNRHVFVYG